MRGSGTQTDPYVIESSNEFYTYIYNNTTYTKKYYKLGCDVDLTNITNKGISSFSNINLDGDGHILKVKITEEQLCKIDGSVKYYSCSLFDYFVSSELHNLKIDLTIDFDMSQLGDIKNLGRMGNWCGLICFSELYTDSTDKNIIENCEITINQKEKSYSEDGISYFATNFQGLGYITDGLEIKDLKLKLNIDKSLGFYSPAPYMDNLVVKGTNTLEWDIKAGDSVVLQGGWFNNTKVTTSPPLTRLDLSHGLVFDYFNTLVENRSFMYEGTFKTLDIYIDNTDNMNGAFKLNVKADKVRILNFKRNNFAENINDSNKIDIYTDVVENLELDATMKLDGYINIHGGVYENIYYVGGLGDEPAHTLIYLNKDNVTEDTIITNDYDVKYSPTYTPEIWEERYKDLYFIESDYTDYIDLFIGTEWLIIPLYDVGDIRFYIDKEHYKYMRFDDTKDVLNDKGLKMFITDGSYKDGRVIKTLPHPDR